MSLKLYRNLLIAVSFVLVALIIWAYDPVKIYQTVITAKFEFLLYAFITTNIVILLRVYKWALLLKTDTKSLIPVQILGICISIFTPARAAEPVKAMILKVTNKIEVSKTLPSIVWERVLDLVVIVIFSVFALLAVKNSAPNLYFISYAGMAIFAVIVSVFLLVLYIKRVGFFIFDKVVVKLPILKRLDRNFMESFYKVKVSNRRVTGGFIVAIMIWLIEGLTVLLVLQAFGIDSISWPLAAGIVALSIMIGTASSLPGGIGSTELVMILLLTAMGVDSTLAVSAVFVYRAMTLIYGILLGGLSFAYLSKKVDFKKVKLF